jgi:hypothetical protein
MVLFMNGRDIKRLALAEGATVSLVTAVDDEVPRRVDHFIVHEYDIPEGCLGGYYPECNPLIPVSHRAEGSFVPASKGVPVRVVADGGQQPLTDSHASLLDTAKRPPVALALAAAAGLLVGAALVRRK